MLDLETTSHDFLGPMGSKSHNAETFLRSMSEERKGKSLSTFDDDMDLEGSEEPLTGEDSGGYALLDPYFDIGDQDGDGALTEAEFKEIIAIFSQQNGVEPGDFDAGQVFSLIDKDNDGKITKSEFFEAFRTSFSPPEEVSVGEGCESDGDFDESVYTNEQPLRGGIEGRVHTLELQNQELVRENQGLTTLVKRLEKQRDQLDQQLKEYKRKEASVDKLHSDLLRLSSECEEYKERAASFERKHELLKKSYEEKLRENKKDTSPLEKSLNERKAKVLELEDIVDSLQGELQRKKANEERILKRLEESEHTNLSLRLDHDVQVEGLQAHIKQLEKGLREMKAMYHSMEREYNNLKQLREEIPSPIKAQEHGQRLSLDAEFVELFQAQELQLGKTPLVTENTCLGKQESEETEVTGNEAESSGVEKELLRVKEENDRLKKENETLFLRAKKLSSALGLEPSTPGTPSLGAATPSLPVSPLNSSPTPFTSTPTSPVSPSTPSTKPSPAVDPSTPSTKPSPPTRTPPRLLRRTISTPASPLTPGLFSSTPISTITTPTKRRGSTFRGSLRLPLPREPFLTPPAKSLSMRLTRQESVESTFREKGREKVQDRGAQEELELQNKMLLEKAEREKNVLRMQVDGLQQKLVEERNRSAELQVLLNRANEKIEAGLMRSAAFAAIADRVSLTHALGLGLLIFLAFAWVLMRLFIAFSPYQLTPS